MESIHKIPNKLFRGDADKSGARKLKETLHYFQLQTNLVNGGQGRDIIEYPIQELVKRHVGIGWNKTHFLSFSSDASIAYNYGMGLPELSKNNDGNQYSEYFDNGDFDFALITLHSDSIKWKELEQGLYEGLFEPSLIKFSRVTDKYRLILVDVVTILTAANNPQFTSSIENGTRDKEWLILPATYVPFNSNRVEYSAILDGACMTYRKYVKH